MNKSKFLILVVIVLLISNGILFFILIKEHNKNEGPKEIIIEKLHFDKEQVKNYETYIQQHRKAVNANEAVMNKLRAKLFQELRNNQQDTVKIDSLISVIGKQQMIAENINYNHFLEIKKMCKPSHQKDFEELTNEIVKLFSNKERK